MNIRHSLRIIFQKTGLLPLAQEGYIWFIKAVNKAEVSIGLPLLSASSVLRRFYFTFFSNTFSSEIKMYLAGRRFYMTQTHKHAPNASLLRRNIHRIEKGLMTNNRKPVFALDYIHETVSQFRAFVNEDSPNELLDWAWDVLNKFFEVTDPHPGLEGPRRTFNSIPYIKSRPDVNFLPYPKESLPPEAEEHLTRLVKSRKSVRTFVPDSCPSREQLTRAVSMASLAPSSCNRQPFAFYLFDRKPTVEAIANLAGGAKSFASNIPALAMVVGSTNASPSPGDRHLMYIDGSLAAMNFILALESMGISTCPINWPDNKGPERELRKLVDLKAYERPILIIAMGKSDREALVACSARKSTTEMCRFNPEKGANKK